MVVQGPDGTVEFRFFRPNARQIALAGDFNNWHQSCLPMTRDADGWWRYQLKLAPGCYQFRYRGDGQWYTDYAAFGVEHGPFGLNSVVLVDPALTKEPQPEPAKPPAVQRMPHISEADPYGFSNRGATADQLWADRHRNPVDAVAV